MVITNVIGTVAIIPAKAPRSSFCGCFGKAIGMIKCSLLQPLGVIILQQGRVDCESGPRALCGRDDYKLNVPRCVARHVNARHASGAVLITFHAVRLVSAAETFKQGRAGVLVGIEEYSFPIHHIATFEDQRFQLAVSALEPGNFLLMDGDASLTEPVTIVLAQA